MIAIIPCGPIAATVSLPGSKYQANRALIMAALANGTSIIHNIPNNDDIALLLKGIEALGADVSVEATRVSITGIRDFAATGLKVEVGNSGTFARFVTALACLFSEPITLTAGSQMATRPMSELMTALRQLGAHYELPEAASLSFPMVCRGPLLGGQCSIDRSKSSQYVSALMIAAQRARQPVRINCLGDAVSEAYLDLTIATLEKFAGQVTRADNQFFIEPRQLVSCELTLTTDAVSATYFQAAALITKGAITIDHYDIDNPQGESAFPELLSSMGAQVVVTGRRLTVSFQTPLSGIEVDMGDMPDAVPTLVALACFADSPTTISNIAHLAYKESNRITATAEEFRKLGAKIDHTDSSMTIHPSQLTGTRVHAHGDHRLAMSLALVGLAVDGVMVEDHLAVDKSFPGYWQTLTDLGVKLENAADRCSNEDWV